jgi:hypothetical protein
VVGTSKRKAPSFIAEKNEDEEIEGNQKNKDVGGYTSELVETWLLLRRCCLLMPAQHQVIDNT